MSEKANAVFEAMTLRCWGGHTEKLPFRHPTIDEWHSNHSKPHNANERLWEDWRSKMDVTDYVRCECDRWVHRTTGLSPFEIFLQGKKLSEVDFNAS